jgi:coatomer protein complex subunit alpha (xenin)
LQVNGSWGSLGDGKGALYVSWYSRSSFAVLTSKRELHFYNRQNEPQGKLTQAEYPPLAKAYRIFPSNVPGLLFICTEDKTHLFDVERKEDIGKINAGGIKEVHIGADNNHIALVSSHGVWIVRKKTEVELLNPASPTDDSSNALLVLCHQFEPLRIKSGKFDKEISVFYYQTWGHMKYLLLNGCSGILKSIDIPSYLVEAARNSYTFIDTRGLLRISNIDSFQLQIKEALRIGDIQKAKQLCSPSTPPAGKKGQPQEKGIHCHSVAEDIMKSGFPMLALSLVPDDDEKTKFQLAIESGQVDTAYQYAEKIKDVECWEALADCALFHGNSGVAEKSLQKALSYRRLSYFYLVTGQMKKLELMIKMAEGEKVNDIQLAYQNALFTGDIAGMARILLKSGQKKLALHLLRTHGFSVLKGAAAAKEESSSSKKGKKKNLVKELLDVAASPNAIESYSEQDAKKEMLDAHNEVYSIKTITSSSSDSTDGERSIIGRLKEPKLFIPPYIISAGDGIWPTLQLSSSDYYANLASHIQGIPVEAEAASSVSTASVGEYIYIYVYLFTVITIL